jgi:hypothetical protein
LTEDGIIARRTEEAVCNEDGLHAVPCQTQATLPSTSDVSRMLSRWVTTDPVGTPRWHYGRVWASFEGVEVEGESRPAPVRRVGRYQAIEPERHRDRAASSPGDPGKLREIAEALGLAEGSDEWRRFFDAARRGGDLPADIRHRADRKLVPALIRTIDDLQLGDEDISRLIADIETRSKATDHAGCPDQGPWDHRIGG